MRSPAYVITLVLLAALGPGCSATSDGRAPRAQALPRWYTDLRTFTRQNPGLYVIGSSTPESVPIRETTTGEGAALRGARADAAYWAHGGTLVLEDFFVASGSGRVLPSWQAAELMDTRKVVALFRLDGEPQPTRSE